MTLTPSDTDNFTTDQQVHIQEYNRQLDEYLEVVTSFAFLDASDEKCSHERSPEHLRLAFTMLEDWHDAICWLIHNVTPLSTVTQEYVDWQLDAYHRVREQLIAFTIEAFLGRDHSGQRYLNALLPY